MKASTRLKSCLALCGVLALATSCKDVSEDTSGLMTDSGNKTVDASGVEQFNLAEYIAKKNIGGPNMKNNIKTGNAYVFFSSNEEQHPDKTNVSEAAKSKNKASILKPEYELRMNATVVSDSKKVELKSLFWFDGSLNGAKVYAGGQLQDERSEPEEILATLRRAPVGAKAVADHVDITPDVVSQPTLVLTVEPSPSRPPIASPSPVEKVTAKEATLPAGKPVPGKPGFVSSPFDNKFIIDVRGFPPGTLVDDPNTGKAFRVP